jgi:hypothetical protein
MGLEKGNEAKGRGGAMGWTERTMKERKIKKRNARGVEGCDGSRRG